MGGHFFSASDNPIPHGARSFALLLRSSALPSFFHFLRICSGFALPQFLPCLGFSASGFFPSPPYSSFNPIVRSSLLLRGRKNRMSHAFSPSFFDGAFFLYCITDRIRMARFRVPPHFGPHASQTDSPRRFSLFPFSYSLFLQFCVF